MIVEIELDNDQFLQIAFAAYRENISINEYIVRVLMDHLNEDK